MSNSAYVILPKTKAAGLGWFGWTVLVGLVIVALLVSATVVAAFLETPQTAARARAASLQQEAVSMAQQAVRQQLKAPSTARFAALAETEIAHTGDRYEITGWVESQNAFGAMLRSGYEVKLQHGAQWTAESVKITPR